MTLLIFINEEQREEWWRLHQQYSELQEQFKAIEITMKDVHEQNEKFVEKDRLARMMNSLSSRMRKLSD